MGLVTIIYILQEVDSSFSPTTRMLTSRYRTEKALNTIAKNIVEDENRNRGLCFKRNMPIIRVIYESDNILAIDKPAHISHHDDHNYMGILSYVRKLQKEKEVSYQGRLWGVHRLDRITSGILLFAK